MRVATEGVYARKLMIKYLIIEIRSLIEIIDRLRAQVMKAPVFNPTKESVWRGITEAEHQRSRELFKEYSSVKLSVEGSIIQIRDNIGAHRGNVDWQQVMRFWDEISMETVSPLLEVVPRVFEHVKELDIYEWNRTPVDGVIEFIGGTLRPESRQAKI